MIRRLFLHAGLPKTGSTSMQKWFLDNRDPMRMARTTQDIRDVADMRKRGHLIEVQVPEEGSTSNR